MNAYDCPGKDQLEAYVVGRLDGGSHLRIDHHLDSCPACQQALESLDGATPDAFPVLQALDAAATPPEAPALRELVAWAKGLASGEAPALPKHRPAPATAAQFVERLAASGLFSTAEAEALAHTLSADAGRQDANDLARQLVASARITTYQAEELAAGRTDALVLGNYVLRQPIGAGGMGRVFRAYHRRMKREVAVKILAPELLRSDMARARFQREIEAVARVASPHIVAAHDAGEDRGRDFLVMEYVAGTNLSDLVKQGGPLPVERALDYVLQAARGLADAHAAGIVHRDVKPSNLLVDANGTVKVLDLGLARVPLTAEEGAGHLTTSSVVAGTAAFMAPEQALNAARVDARADVYSLGCTLFYLLTGRAPYEGQTSMEVLFAHREQPLPELPNAAPAVNDLFRRLVGKRPEDRPASMAAVVAELERLPRKAPTAPPRRRKQWRNAAAVVAAGVLLVLALRFLATSADLVVTDVRPTTAAAPREPAMAMIRLPPGEFWMGADDTDPNSRADEKPRHLVKLTQGFQLGKYKVTQAEYREVMGNNPSAFRPDGRFHAKASDTGRHPVESVPWLDALLFCNRLSDRHGLTPYYRIDGETVTVRGGTGFRLPTEAEWEYAARGGTDTRWHFGDSSAKLGDYAWFADNSSGTTHPVGQKLANPLGLFDMHGNVPEWCWDRYSPDYYRDSPTSDPPGPGQGKTRVARGGAWNDVAARTRAAARATLGEHYGFLTPIGLRVARSN